MAFEACDIPGLCDDHEEEDGNLVLLQRRSRGSKANAQLVLMAEVSSIVTIQEMHVVDSPQAPTQPALAPSLEWVRRRRIQRQLHAPAPSPLYAPAGEEQPIWPRQQSVWRPGPCSPTTLNGPSAEAGCWYWGGAFVEDGVNRWCCETPGMRMQISSDHASCQCVPSPVPPAAPPIDGACRPTALTKASAEASCWYWGSATGPYGVRKWCCETPGQKTRINASEGTCMCVPSAAPPPAPAPGPPSSPRSLSEDGACRPTLLTKASAEAGCWYWGTATGPYGVKRWCCETPGQKAQIDAHKGTCTCVLSPAAPLSQQIDAHKGACSPTELTKPSAEASCWYWGTATGPYGVRKWCCETPGQKTQIDAHKGTCSCVAASVPQLDADVEGACSPTQLTKPSAEASCWYWGAATGVYGVRRWCCEKPGQKTHINATTGTCVCT